MVYLDNAATTFLKPKSVYKAIEKAIKLYAANPGRSGHREAYKAMEAIYEARCSVSELFNAPGPESVVFTYNATYALNIAIKSLISEKCHVIISDMEHNSVLRPINKLRDSIGVEYSVFDSSKPNLFFEIEEKIRPDTRFIVTTLRSNVTGRDIDIHAIAQIKKKYGIGVIIDASQAAGHKSIDFRSIDCDAMACPGHKGLFGISGSGFAIFKDKHLKNSVIEGGSGNDSLNPSMPDLLPEAYEAGTLGVAGILSVDAGIKFINKVGVLEISSKLDELTNRCLQMLNDVSSVKIVEGANGIISVSANGFSNYELADRLNKSRICIRNGLHCAPLAHKTLNTIESGTVRISFSYFNKTSDIDKLYRCIKGIK